jgi:hypothetical protein
MPQFVVPLATNCTHQGPQTWPIRCTRLCCATGIIIQRYLLYNDIKLLVIVGMKHDAVFLRLNTS